MTYCIEPTEIQTAPNPATSLVAWTAAFFHLHRRRRNALKDMRKLSDRELHDIGIDRRDITALVDREMGRLRLDEFRSRY